VKKNEQLQLSLCVPLAAAVVISAVWVVKTKHQSRQLFVELEALNRERDRLQVDWGRLQLEESTWGTHSRVETLARTRLSLDQPTPEQVLVVTEPAR
jgi:cell division protein FtsL